MKLTIEIEIREEWDKEGERIDVRFDLYFSKPPSRRVLCGHNLNHQQLKKSLSELVDDL